MTALLLAALALAPPLQDLHVTNGSVPFASDRRLLTTVSPNGDGFRDAAYVHFRLARPARVELDVVATNMIRAGKTGTSRVWHTARVFAAGPAVLAWHPARTTQPRTYILRLRVGSRVYGTYGPGGRQDAPVGEAADDAAPSLDRDDPAAVLDGERAVVLTARPRGRHGGHDQRREQGKGEETPPHVRQYRRCNCAPNQWNVRKL